MKNIIIALSIASFFLFVPSVMAEEISDFTQTVKIEENGDLKIKEVITYDFGSEQKHGIFRDIPYKYKARGGNYNLRLDDISVTDDQGNDYDFKILKEGDSKRIKIGNKDILVSGQKTYQINYNVKRAINFFDDHDELYWNVTGDKWPVKIRQSKSTVILPASINEKDLKAECFSGAYGSAEECVSKRYIYTGTAIVKEVVFIDDVLSLDKGLTVVISLPKNIIHEPSWLSNIFNIILDNIVLVLPVLVFIFMFSLWRAKGQDRGGRKTIIAQFEAPEGLSPMGVGVLLDERADNKDFSANIISLAVKGYLKIIKVEEKSIFKKDDYVLVSLPGKERLQKSEDSILKKIFKKSHLLKEEDKKGIIQETLKSVSGDVVLLSDLKNIFYRDLETIKKDIYEELFQAGYFYKNPQKTRAIYTSFGMVFIFFVWLFGGYFSFMSVVSLTVSAVVVIAFAQFMPKRSKKGVLAREHILGLKKYLEVAEKDRLDFHNAPEKNPKTFEKLLPFAMALGVEKKWAKQFEGILKNSQTTWYSDSSGRAFSALALTNSLNSFSASASSVASSSPSSASSGGSGFSGGGSGGGFGGGGGGSW